MNFSRVAGLMKKLLIASLFMLPFWTVCYWQRQPSATRLFLNPVIETKEDAHVSVRPEKAEYRGTEAIKLHITLKNTGGKAFEVFPADAESFYVIEVIGPEGQKLSYKRKRRSGSMRTPFVSMTGKEVRPEETLKGTVWLNNLFDMSVPGCYKVTVSTTFRLGTKGEKFVVIGSEPSMVQVLGFSPVSPQVNCC